MAGNEWQLPLLFSTTDAVTTELIWLVNSNQVFINIKFISSLFE